MSELLLKVVLDACVIFQAPLRDTLLRAAEHRLYEVCWSDMILSEVSRNLVSSGRMSQKQVQRLLEKMRQFFPNATVRGFSDIIPDMTNNEKDRHVLAAAVAGSADTIVTSNLRDFPDRALEPFEIEAKSPDQFLMILFRQDSDTMMRIVREQAEEVLSDIALVAPQFAAEVRSGLGERE